MALESVIKVTKSQYNILVGGGTITKDGVTYSYNANAIYLIKEDNEELHTASAEFVIGTIDFTVTGIKGISGSRTWTITDGSTWQDLITNGTRDTTNTCYFISGGNTSISGVTYVRAVSASGSVSNLTQVYTTSSYTQACISTDKIRSQAYYSVDPSSQN